MDNNWQKFVDFVFNSRDGQFYWSEENVFLGYCFETSVKSESKYGFLMSHFQISIL